MQKHEHYITDWMNQNILSTTDLADSFLKIQPFLKDKNIFNYTDVQVKALVNMLPYLLDMSKVHFKDKTSFIELLHTDLCYTYHDRKVVIFTVETVTAAEYISANTRWSIKTKFQNYRELGSLYLIYHIGTQQFILCHPATHQCCYTNDEQVTDASVLNDIIQCAILEQECLQSEFFRLVEHTSYVKEQCAKKPWLNFYVSGEIPRYTKGYQGTTMLNWLPKDICDRIVNFAYTYHMLWQPDGNYKFAPTHTTPEMQYIEDCMRATGVGFKLLFERLDRIVLVKRNTVMKTAYMFTLGDDRVEEVSGQYAMWMGPGVVVTLYE